MKRADNILLVEDEAKWSQIYERAARQVGAAGIKVAATLDEAIRCVDEMRFAVALVDIGLEEADDRNVDGLLVMEKIRSMGDPTSIVVITGRSGRDVIPIVRDAIKKYDAYDAVAKPTLVPAQLRELVRGGILAQRAGAKDRALLRDALRGEMEQPVWDDHIMRSCGLGDGVNGLYRMIEGLFGPFMPLVPGCPRGVQATGDVACGVFWSRGAGQAVVGCFGREERVEAVADEAEAQGLLLETHPVGALLGHCRTGSGYGVVYSLAGRARDDFESSG